MLFRSSLIVLNDWMPAGNFLMLMSAMSESPIFFAKIKKKSEKTNECIRKIYFSLLFSPLPFIFSPFFPAVFPGCREKLEKGASVLYLCIVDKKSYCDVAKSLHPSPVACKLLCDRMLRDKLLKIALHHPSPPFIFKKEQVGRRCLQNDMTIAN